MLARGDGVGALEAPRTSTTEVDPATYRRTEYLRARAAARAWLDALDVDPVELSRHGNKREKKLAEILTAILRC
jgi:4'-phosphopantetheinyl transferase EntD